MTPTTPKSRDADLTQESLEVIGRSYYLFCLEQALANVLQARALMRGDVIDLNHELPEIQRLLEEAIEAS